MKPGFKTTEFWLTLAASVATTVLPDFPITAALSVVAYVISRGWAKSKSA